MREAEPASELAHFVLLAGADERDADALAPGAAGAPDPMDVGVVVVRRVEVDHVRDAVDVDAPGGDVGGHQRVDAARL